MVLLDGALEGGDRRSIITERAFEKVPHGRETRDGLLRLVGKMSASLGVLSDPSGCAEFNGGRHADSFDA